MEDLEASSDIYASVSNKVTFSLLKSQNRLLYRFIQKVLNKGYFTFNEAFLNIIFNPLKHVTNL